MSRSPSPPPPQSRYYTSTTLPQPTALTAATSSSRHSSSPTSRIENASTIYNSFLDHAPTFSDAAPPPPTVSYSYSYSPYPSNYRPSLANAHLLNSDFDDAPPPSGDSSSSIYGSRDEGFGYTFDHASRTSRRASLTSFAPQSPGRGGVSNFATAGFNRRASVSEQTSSSLWSRDYTSSPTLRYPSQREYSPSMFPSQAQPSPGPLVRSPPRTPSPTPWDYSSTSARLYIPVSQPSSVYPSPSSSSVVSAQSTFPSSSRSVPTQPSTENRRRTIVPASQQPSNYPNYILSTLDPQLSLPSPASGSCVISTNLHPWNQLTRSSARRGHSQVDPDSPLHSRASSPALIDSGYGSQEQQHPSPRSAPRTTLDPSVPNVRAVRQRSDSSLLPPPWRALNSTNVGSRPRSPSPARQSFPAATSTLPTSPLGGAPSTSSGQGSGINSWNQVASREPLRRSRFSSEDLTKLSDAWRDGHYYPSSEMVVDLIGSTSLTRTQIRGWFANKRGRATGEEKEKLSETAKRLASSGSMY